MFQGGLMEQKEMAFELGDLAQRKETNAS